MPRDIAPSAIEKEFLVAALKEGFRQDGRAFEELRDLNLGFSSEFGFVECCLGRTRVAAQVSAQVIKPAPERPYEGVIILSTEISPMASTSYEAGRSSEDETIIARLLEKALRQSQAIDREGLCIVAGEKVWAIRIDLHFLDDQGNLVDCAAIAAMAALQHFRKPEVSVEGYEVVIHTMEEREPIPLALHHYPYCLTFAFFGSDLAVVDPTHLEIQLAEGTLTLTLNAQSEICVLTKAGGSPMKVVDIMRCLNLASTRIKDIDKLVKAAVEQDLKGKLSNDDGGRGTTIR